MPLAMLVTLVGVTLSAGLGGVVVDRFKQSQRLADRVAAVDAAPNAFVWVGKCSDNGTNLNWTIYEDAPTRRRLRPR